MELSDTDTQELLTNLVIPPRPAVLDDLDRLRRDPECDLARLADVVSSDLALAAATLKASNSPLIGQGRTLTSIPQALAMLGLKNFLNLVNGLVVRTTLSSPTPPFVETYWDFSMMVSLVSQLLGDRLGNCPEATTSYALFHGCGIPVLLMRDPNYAQTLLKLLQSRDDEVVALEEARHRTHHAVIGYLVARAWNMPKEFANAILDQHELAPMLASGRSRHSHDTLTMMAICRAASHTVRTLTGVSSDPAWPDLAPVIVPFLGMTDSEFEDWVDYTQQRINGVR